MVSPYFCFYAGKQLVSLVKAEVVKPSAGNKKQVIAEFCTGMDKKVFTARKNMIEKTLSGKPCIETYDAVYTDPTAIKFDPISKVITARAMCAEFVKEINELIEVNKANTVNATRYSYLISQQVDLQTQLIDTYSSCVVAEAEADPR